MRSIDISRLLDQTPDSSTLGLVDWYATPWTPAAAQPLRQRIRQRQQTALKAGQPVFVLQLLDLIAGYWWDRSWEMHYASLRTNCRREQEHALLDLVAGQLLVSCKREPAHQLLQQAFDRAAVLLPPPDYFVVMKRHALLRQLPLTPSGVAAADLDTLLAEARVIERLRGPGARGVRPPRDHGDTLG